MPRSSLFPHTSQRCRMFHLYVLYSTEDYLAIRWNNTHKKSKASAVEKNQYSRPHYTQIDVSIAIRLEIHPTPSIAYANTCITQQLNNTDHILQMMTRHTYFWIHMMDEYQIYRNRFIVSMDFCFSLLQRDYKSCIYIDSVEKGV